MRRRKQQYSSKSHQSEESLDEPPPVINNDGDKPYRILMIGTVPSERNNKALRQEERLSPDPTHDCKGNFGLGYYDFEENANRIQYNYDIRYMIYDPNGVDDGRFCMGISIPERFKKNVINHDLRTHSLPKNIGKFDIIYIDSNSLGYIAANTDWQTLNHWVGLFEPLLLEHGCFVIDDDYMKFDVEKDPRFMAFHLPHPNERSLTWYGDLFLTVFRYGFQRHGSQTLILFRTPYIKPMIGKNISPLTVRLPDYRSLVTMPAAPYKPPENYSVKTTPPADDQPTYNFDLNNQSQTVFSSSVNELTDEQIEDIQEEYKSRFEELREIWELVRDPLKPGEHRSEEYEIHCDSQNDLIRIKDRTYYHHYYDT